MKLLAVISIIVVIIFLLDFFTVGGHRPKVNKCDQLGYMPWTVVDGPQREAYLQAVFGYVAPTPPPELWGIPDELEYVMTEQPRWEITTPAGTRYWPTYNNWDEVERGIDRHFVDRRNAKEFFATHISGNFNDWLEGCVEQQTKELALRDTKLKVEALRRNRILATEMGTAWHRMGRPTSSPIYRVGIRGWWVQNNVRLANMLRAGVPR